MAQKTLSINSGTLDSIVQLRTFQTDLNDNFTELYTANEPGTDITAVEITNDKVDWDAGTMQYIHGGGSATITLTDENIPEFPLMKELSVHVNGVTTLNVPAYWLEQNAFYSNNPNLIKLTCAEYVPTLQNFQITLEGTVGHASIDGKMLTFVDDLETTAENFVTANAAYFLSTHGLVVTSVAEVIHFVQSAAVYTELSPTDITKLPGNLAGNVVNTHANTVAEKQITTVTLSGTGGFADISCVGLTAKRATFNGTLGQTATDFKTAHEAYYLTNGIVLTANSADLVFTANVAGTGFGNITISNIASDVAGAVTHTHANVPAVAQVYKSVITGTSGSGVISGVGGLLNTITFGTDLNTTIATFKTNNETEYDGVGVVLTKEDAEAQVDTVTLTAGTSGTADMVITGLTTKTISFDTDLAGTATKFFTDHAAYYSTQGITVTHSGADIIFTADVLGTAFAHPVVNNPSNDIAGSNVTTNENVTAKLIWTAKTAGTEMVQPAFTPDLGNLACSTTETTPNTPAEKQIETIVLSGTFGTATLSEDGDDYTLTFVDTLGNMASTFVTDNAADFLSDYGVVLTANGVNLVLTADVAGTGFVAPTVANVPSGNLAGSVVNTHVNVPAAKQIDTLTLTGTGGQATIDTIAVVYVTSPTETATAFKNANAAAYFSTDIVLTSSGADLIFTAKTAGTGFTSPVIVNVPGDLDGTLVENQPYVGPTIYCQYVNAAP